MFGIIWLNPLFPYWNVWTQQAAISTRISFPYQHQNPDEATKKRKFRRFLAIVVRYRFLTSRMIPGNEGVSKSSSSGSSRCTRFVVICTHRDHLRRSSWPCREDEGEGCDPRQHLLVWKLRKGIEVNVCKCYIIYYIPNVLQKSIQYQRILAWTLLKIIGL